MFTSTFQHQNNSIRINWLDFDSFVVNHPEGITKLQCQHENKNEKNK